MRSFASSPPLLPRLRYSSRGNLARALLTAALSLVLLMGPVDAQAASCVDINIAAAAELQRIIHIGPARAAEIVQLRQQRPFASVDQLTRVRGIAAARLRDINQQGLACVKRSGS
jgi:competence ComEA-like helix-hairpin-helix protein